jgi:hypothetical protein
MATTKITSNVLALSAAQTNINNDGSFTLSVPTQINNTLSLSGNLTVDTNTLFVDSVNNRVGIGTTTPQSTFMLDVNGQVVIRGDNYLNGSLREFGVNAYKLSKTGDSWINGGNVGIGTTTPNEKLTVVGNISATGNLTVDTNTLFVNAANDRVGIGTTTPTFKLQLSGASTLGIDTAGSEPAIVGGASGISLKVSSGAASIFRGLDGWGGTWIDLAPTTYFQVGRASGNTMFSSLLGQSFNRLSFTVSNTTNNGVVFTTETGSLSSPVGYFEIRQGSTPNFLVQKTTGNVGIGTTTPYSTLGVNGNLATMGTGKGLLFYNLVGTGEYAGNYEMMRFMPVSNTYLIQSLTGGTGQHRNLQFSIGNATMLLNAGNGNVGIGTTTPSERLTVSGNISASGTVIASNYNPAANVAAFLADPTSAKLAAAVTDETGSGSLVFGTSPTLVSPTINTEATFNATSYTYGTDAAAAHRTALGLDTLLNAKANLSGGNTFTGTQTISGSSLTLQNAGTVTLTLNDTAFANIPTFNLQQAGTTRARIEGGVGLTSRMDFSVGLPISRSMSLNQGGTQNYGVTIGRSSVAGNVAPPTDGLHVQGTVAIGTTTPNEKLTVVGNISATGIVTAEGNKLAAETFAIAMAIAVG